MNFNSISTGIELLGCTVTNLRVKNSIVDLKPNAKKSFGLNVTNPIEHGENDDYYITITIEIKVEMDQGDDGKTDLVIDIEGAFKPKEHASKEEFMRLIALNGVSALIGIARGKIESVSATTYNSGKITIPFVNVLEYYQEVMKK